MNDSLMSIESSHDQFDDDDFIRQALNDSSSSQNNFQVPAPTIDVSNLIYEMPNLPKCRLDFNTLDTPRNGLAVHNRKRKNFSRRCLSADLNSEHSENGQMSFQEFRFSKENKISNESSTTFKSPAILSSIENSPKIASKSNQELNISLELTPEFNNHVGKKQQQSKPKDESDINPKFPLKSSNNLNRNNNGDKVMLQKYFSENHASIMRAVQISSSNPSLIGDFTKTYVLPLMENSKHQDLKSITCHVLADLLQQRYVDFIASFTIIDCRYPYEYDGGHIKTAINLYTQEHIINRFIKNKPKEAEATQSNSNKRDILIFHCEFSSERGPSLYRFLRNKDRVKNSRVYPNLHYPEIYLLDGGYKEFFNHYSDLCEPCAYQPMHSKSHEEDLRKFRSICKSFDSKYSTHKRNLRL